MIYNDFKGLKLSSLGMGCMRFPVLEKNSQIDTVAAEKILSSAFENGINYFDTAWGYHGGNAEAFVGDFLSKFPRESFYLASKFPGYDRNYIDKLPELFEEQLKRCKVDYFDFYLLHNVYEENIDDYLDEKYGIAQFLIKQKELGRIRHLGFSVHGSCEVMERILDAYGDNIDFCQIQLNWLDYFVQNAKAKVEALNKRNIAIWVMEPVRGGKLINLPDEYAHELKSAHPDWTMAQWCFRFVKSLKGVTMILSGMSALEQLDENLSTFSDDVALTPDDLEVLFSVARKMTDSHIVPCTACSYCTSYCPQELNIPWLIELNNEFSFSKGKGTIVNMRMEGLAEEKSPSACIGCRSCESVCPQKIEISKVMSDFARALKK